MRHVYRSGIDPVDMLLERIRLAALSNAVSPREEYASMPHNYTIHSGHECHVADAVPGGLPTYSYIK